MELINVNDYLKKYDNNFVKEFKKIFLNYFELDKSFINLTSKEENILKEDLKKIIKITEKHIDGVDVTFELGKRKFYNIELNLTKGVFVPQFDTEILVDSVLEYKNTFKNGIEIGVGTGAISISIMKNSDILMNGIDVNELAIELSKNNLIKNNLIYDNNFKLENVFDSCEEKKYDFLVSNPPYIDVGDKNISMWVKENQPKEALYAKDKGLEFYKYLIDNYKNFINNQGMMFFEIGFNQKEILEKYLINNDFIEFFNFRKDYNSNWRVLMIKFK